MYQWSKLKRFLRVVTAMQQDTMRFLVEGSAREYTEFIERACEGDVKVTGVNEVKCEVAICLSKS